jgi:hypothetical protein
MWSAKFLEAAFLLVAAGSLILSPLRLSAATMQQELTATLDQPVQSGAPGSSLVYTGTITNPVGPDLFINGLAFLINGSVSLSGESSEFQWGLSDALFNTGGNIPNGFTGLFFFVDVLAGTRPGSFVDGEFIIDTELVGGGPGGVIETPGQVILTFEATVSGSSIAPEPTYLALVVSGIGIGAAVLTRHLASAQSQRPR